MSDVSGVSERDAAHLRQLSDGAISVASAHDNPVPAPLRTPSNRQGLEQTPIISPPSADENAGGDYISAKEVPAPAPERKSVFKEEQDESDKQK